MRSVSIAIGTALYAVTLWVIIGVKLALFGWGSFIEHFTNWGYVLHAVSMTVGAFANVFSIETWRWPIVVTFMPITAISWMIGISVNVLYLVDSDMLRDFVAEYDVGLVVFGNEVVHSIPVFANIAYIAFNYPILYMAFHQARKTFAHPAAETLFWLYQTVFGASVIYLWYVIVLSIRDTTVSTVYMTTTFGTWSGLLGIIVSGVVVNGVITCILVNDGIGGDDTDDVVKLMSLETRMSERDAMREFVQTQSKVKV
jgi:hypothetical protein